MLIEGTGSASLNLLAHTDSRKSSAQMSCRLTGQNVPLRISPSVNLLNGSLKKVSKSYSDKSGKIKSCCLAYYFSYGNWHESNLVLEKKTG